MTHLLFSLLSLTSSIVHADEQLPRYSISCENDEYRFEVNRDENGYYGNIIAQPDQNIGAREMKLVPSPKNGILLAYVNKNFTRTFDRVRIEVSTQESSPNEFIGNLEWKTLVDTYEAKMKCRLSTKE